MGQKFKMTFPPEPGPEVTHVRDVDKDVWERDATPNGLGWLLRSRGLIASWPDLADYAPLEDVTPEPAPYALPEQPPIGTELVNAKGDMTFVRVDRHSRNQWQETGNRSVWFWWHDLLEAHGPLTRNV